MQCPYKFILAYSSKRRKAGKKHLLWKSLYSDRRGSTTAHVACLYNVASQAYSVESTILGVPQGKPREFRGERSAAGVMSL